MLATQLKWVEIWNTVIQVCSEFGWVFLGLTLFVTIFTLFSRAESEDTKLLMRFILGFGVVAVLLLGVSGYSRYAAPKQIAKSTTGDPKVVLVTTQHGTYVFDAKKIQRRPGSYEPLNEAPIDVQYFNNWTFNQEHRKVKLTLNDMKSYCVESATKLWERIL